MGKVFLEHDNCRTPWDSNPIGGFFMLVSFDLYFLHIKILNNFNS